jgi:hypothetical protein
MTRISQFLERDSWVIRTYYKQLDRDTNSVKIKFNINAAHHGDLSYLKNPRKLKETVEMQHSHDCISRDFFQSPA